jgi:predicted ATP-binding protein involved in virulence
MNPFRITSLEAHQIGPFGDLKMTFPEKPAGMTDKAEIHILTGENGVGKSTVLEMLTGCSDGMNLNYSRFRLPIGTHRNFNVQLTGGEQFTLSSDSLGGYKHNFSEKLNKYVIATENKYHSTPFEFAFFAYSSYRKISQEYVQSTEDPNVHPLLTASSFYKNNQPNQILQWIANNISKEAIAQKQFDENRANRYRNAVKTLEQVLSKIIEKEIKFYIEIELFIVKIEIDQERLDFDTLPDGLKSIISWLADLLMRMDRVKWVDDIPVFERNFILFLDEIEVHMHPRWQRKILPAVQGLFPNAQIFISTHSPFVINSVDGAWIHRLVKPNGDSEALEPVLSEDGKSIYQVLEEIFDITERFGVGPEADLKRFYEIRNRLIKNGSDNGKDKEELIQIAKKLQGQSTTLDQIVAMEIRQLNRLKQLEINV